MASENEAADGKKSLRRQRRAEEGAELMTSYDSMLCVDAVGATTNKRKEYCPQCGLPRDPELALRSPCGACSTPENPVYGTQKRQPQFDSDGERIPDEVIAARNADRLRALQAGRAAQRAKVAAQIAAVPQNVVSHPAQVAAVKRAAKPARAAAPATKATTQDLFLLMTME